MLPRAYHQCQAMTYFPRNNNQKKKKKNPTFLAHKMATVIVGAGIIGTSTAYYLSNSSANPQKIHLVEACPELFASASGYAAGFLARDWFSPQLAKLGELSFDLHKQLAEENDGYERWGYTRSTGTSLAEAAAGGEVGDSSLIVGRGADGNGSGL